jgi:hypothetical protein
MRCRSSINRRTPHHLLDVERLLNAAAYTVPDHEPGHLSSVDQDNALTQQLRRLARAGREGGCRHEEAFAGFEAIERQTSW